MNEQQLKPDFRDTPKIQRLRLVRLAKMLENWTEERERLECPVRFDMNDWYCGTAACALGSAALHPYFNRHGLALRGWSAAPTYKSYAGYGAASQFFGIPRAQACWLFDPGEYTQKRILPRHVAKRVREIISGEAPYADAV